MNLKHIRTRAISELKKSGIKTSEIDIDIILQYVLDKNDVFIFSHPDFPLTNSAYQKFRRLIRKRKIGFPIAYLTGCKEFYGIDFLVNKNVLIPRPETEELVEMAIQFIKLKVHRVSKLSVIDIGTGCGNIIISVSKNISINLPSSDLQLIATDISEKALRVARQNAKLQGFHKNIKFYRSDLFHNKRLPKYYDLILANLPYVPESKRNHVQEIDFEPQNAIFSPDNGGAIIKELIDQARNRLNNKGLILLEADPRNINEIKKYALKYFSNVEIIKDLSGRDRFLKVLHN